jgi:hypothetical protein
MRNMYKSLVGRPRRTRPLRRSRHKCKDNIKIDLEEVGLEGVDWIHLVQDRNL